jgi:hypothetical protein
LAFFPGAVLFPLGLVVSSRCIVATVDFCRRALGPFVPRAPGVDFRISCGGWRTQLAGCSLSASLGALWGTSTALVAIVPPEQRPTDLPENAPLVARPAHRSAATLALSLAVMVIADGSLRHRRSDDSRGLLGLVDTNAAMWVN